MHMKTLNSLARHWAQLRGTADAFIFLGPGNVEKERLSFRDLHHVSAHLAQEMRSQVPAGARVLLMFETGLAFVLAFFACHRAGLVPVPVVPIRKGRMRDAAISVAMDCQPGLLVGPADQVAAARQAFAGETPLASVSLMELEFSSLMQRYRDEPIMASAIEEDETAIAFLQYTSGSTGAPKGVQVSQANLFANLEMMRLAMKNPWGAVYVGWAPLYHDMGLVANILEPFYLGGQCILMPPAQMAQSPWLWLKAISTYRAHTSGGSNFAYDLCIARSRRIAQETLDLSCWKVAFNSAEPVRADTVQEFCATFRGFGFDSEAMFPCYGMAEATLLISGGGEHRRPVITRISRSGLAQGLVEAPRDAEDEKSLVGCGSALAGEGIAIVDPQNLSELPQAHVGEIWVSGDHIPAGYWRNESASADTFHAHTADQAGQRRYLRTGDLGFIRDGEIYITGRIKDVLIVRGRNVYPQDLERIAQRAFPGLGEGAAAAFQVGHERLALVVEVDRSLRNKFDAAAAIKAIREAVMHEFELSLHEIGFLAPASIPLTTSGKVRRRETLRRFEQGQFSFLQAAQATDRSNAHMEPV